MTKVLENGQLEWIFEATTEELEKERMDLIKKHNALLDNHQIALEMKKFKAAVLLFDNASETLTMITKISDELISRIWDGEM